MTGASGYVGGQFLYDLCSKYPEYQVVALVRTEEKRAKVVNIHPAITLLIGDLDTSDIIVEESSKADVVLRKRN